MNEKLKDKNMDDLFEAILCLETVEECYKFLMIYVQFWN